MACSKYTLTNTGSTIVTFNYRRCDDSQWEYQTELEPNQTKNIWLINNTYSTAQATSISLVNQGPFPPLNATPTPTPSPTVTPTNTSTPTQTSTNTPTPTPTNTQTGTPNVTSTPTNTATNTSTPTPSATNTSTPTPTPTETNSPARTAFVCCHSETSAIDACSCVGTATIFGTDAVFTNNTKFYGCENGPCPGVNLIGWYTYAGAVYQLDSNGNVLGYSGCSVTPTPTPTNTVTPTVTSTPTATPGWVTYSLGTGSTSTLACSATPQNIYGAPNQVDGPDFGETLYTNTALSNPAPNGFYSNGTNWWQVSGGSGVISAGGLC